MSRLRLLTSPVWLSLLALLAIAQSSVAAVAPPDVTSFAPASAYEGEYGHTITITGSNFAGASSVNIGGHPASFRVVSDTIIKAEVPVSAYTYWIVVTTPGGIGYSKDNFVIKPIPAPTITSLSPTSAYVGEVGQTVTITGTNFKGVTTTKKFSGTTAVTIGGQNANFTVVNATTIKAIVPASASTYWITVTTSGGTAYSIDNFVINPVAIPSISSFSPVSSYAGESGSKVTINGQNFKGTGTVNGLFKVTSVLIGGSPASFNVVNDTTIMAVVPENVMYPIYPISVANSGGTGYSKDNYTVMSVPVPTITSFTPTYSCVGETRCKVSITGTNFKGKGSLKGLITTSSVMIGGTSASFKVVNDTSITAVVPVVVAYAAYPITVTTNGGTAYSNDNFIVKPIPAPTITSFSPSSGGVGDTVTITGTNFNGISAASDDFTGTSMVKIGGTPTSFTVVSDTSITAKVPANAAYPIYQISVATSGGTVFSASNFTINTLVPPVITSFFPTKGKAGDVVTITGKNFAETTSVKFNGLAASTFTVVSATSITATVPDDATSGKISVTTPGGTATSASNFTVLYTPTITSFSPISGKVGDIVTITGTNFTGATGVKFNGLSAVTFTVVSATSTSATVPDGATTGKITVTTPGGTATSADDFTVYQLPTISLFAPDSGKVGDVVTVTGTYLLGSSEVTFNGLSADAFTVVSATSITATVPTGATTGKIAVTTPGGTATSADDFTVNAAFVYTWHRYGSSEYALTSSRTLWWDNEAEAVSVGGHLVTIESADENRWLADTFANIYCIGYDGIQGGAIAQIGYYHDEQTGNWEWVSGKPVGYRNLYAMFPQGGALGYMHVRPHPDTTYSWNANPEHTVGENLAYGIIERPSSSIPSIISFSPTNGKPSDVVTIIGRFLSEAYAVSFNGVSANFTVNSDTSISATVPSGALTGKISVSAPGNVAISADDFTVLQSGAIAIAAGNQHTVELSSDGYLKFWGENNYGQCNDPSPNIDFIGIAAGEGHTVGLKRDGSVISWGLNAYNLLITPAPNQDFTAISAAGCVTAGLKRDGSVVCWGDNSTGQCNVPAPNENFIAVSAGDYRCTGLKRDGTLVTWGENTYVPDINQDFIAVAVGRSQSIALKRDCSVVAWGNNYFGQLNVPTPNQDFVSIASGECHNVGLKRDGSVVCWGNNVWGQCNVPEPNSDFVAIAASYYHSVGLKRDGTVIHWGQGIQAISPTQGKAGDAVTIQGMCLTGASAVLFNGTNASYTVEGASYIKAIVPNGASTGRITVVTPGGVATSPVDFEVFEKPSITSFSPTYGKAGEVATISIKGTNFLGTTLVAVNGIGTSFTVVSPTSMDVYVYLGTSGHISITTPGGTATSETEFTVYQSPSILSFSPTSGKTGDKITVTGTNLTAASVVSLNDISCDFTVNSDTTISATVPIGASTGKITVTTVGGTACSADEFVIYQAPTITSFAPASGKVGDNVTVIGMNYTDVSEVAFNGTTAAFTVSNATSVIATVPIGATSGKITVVTVGGMATSLEDFTVIQQLPKSGAITVWGDSSNGKCDIPSVNEDFVTVAGGDMQTLGLKTDGSIVCFGLKHPDMCLVPEPNHDYIAISSRRYLSVALRNDGSVVCWGVDGQPQCTIPVPNMGFTSVGVGWYHVVGLKSDGSVAVWGLNDSGQCDVPSDNSNFVAVAAGAFHSLGLKKDGTVVGWGRNECSQCEPPFPNSDFIAVAAGDYHSLGLKSDGSIVCWGGWDVFATGQCRVPEPNRDFVAIAAGSQHSIGLKRDGTIVCWGLNTDGQCSVPSPNRGFIGIGAGGTTTIAIRAIQPISGQMQLGNFVGDVSSQQLTATICNVFDANTSQILKLLPQSGGYFSLSTYLQPPYDIRISGSHYLAKKITNVSVDQSLNVALVNGDADGNNSVDLFDYAVLDAHLNTADNMADLDGSGQVNLFDYAIIDQNFGARGD